MSPVVAPRGRSPWLLSAAVIVLAVGCGGGSGGSDAGSASIGASAVTQPASSTAAVEPAQPGESAPTVAPSPSATAPTTTITLPPIEPLPIPALIPLDDETPEPVVPLGSIAIPAINIDRPMFEGIRLPTFDLGPGHWPGTAMPGRVGNVVIGGHRTESNADFGDLDLLRPGNEVMLTDNAGATFTYVVQSTEIIDPFSALIVNQTREKTATLFACHPKGSTDQRIVVRLALAA